MDWTGGAATKASTSWITWLATISPMPNFAASLRKALPERACQLSPNSISSRFATSSATCDRLQGSAGARDLPGDAARGKTIFFGSAGCSNCHTLSGNGGFLGPDLSSYGTNASVTAIRDAITRRDRVEPAGYRSAVLTTLQGERLEGVIRNEDNFSIQLLAKDGIFHFLQRTDLQKVESPGHSLMPSDYGDRLSATDLNDLVSYIIKSASTASATTPENPWE